MKPTLKFTCNRMQHKNMQSRSRFFRLSCFCDFFLAALLVALFEASHPAAGEQIVVTDKFAIAIDTNAPPTTVLAARELHRVIALSTGAELKVVTDAKVSPAIRLVSNNALLPDAFEIRIEKNDLVIAGNESEPKGMWELPSHGTHSGAMGVSGAICRSALVVSR